jgi:hypothetical protein
MINGNPSLPGIIAAIAPGYKKRAHNIAGTNRWSGAGLANRVHAGTRGLRAGRRVNP